jgi:hypothetical protein
VKPNPSLAWTHAWRGRGSDQRWSFAQNLCDATTRVLSVPVFFDRLKGESMKRSWMMTCSLIGVFALGSMSLAQDGSKNEDKQEEKKGEVRVKTTGKLIMVGPDGKVIEKTFGDGELVEGKELKVEVKAGKDGEEQEIILVTPDGKKKTVVLNKVDVHSSEVKDADGKKTIRLEAKVVGGDGEHKTIVIGGDGKTFDVKGVGIDIEKIKKLVEEKKGDVKPDEIMAIIKSVEGKPLGGAMRLQLQKVEGHPHVIVGSASASASSGDVAGKLDKILDRLEKLEERLSKLEKKD